MQSDRRDYRSETPLGLYAIGRTTKLGASLETDNLLDKQILTLHRRSLLPIV